MSRKIAIIAIQHPQHDNLYLHGLRADDDTWCIPGGHFESGEDSETAGKRELFEETGLVADLLQVHNQQDLDWQGKPLHIFLFMGKNPSGNLTASNDPDAEFKEFRYIDPESNAYSFRVPKEKNILLAWLHDQKLQKSMFEENDLSKVEKPPMVVGEINNKGDVATKHHKFQNTLVWEHHPEKQQYFHALVDQNRDSFIGSLPDSHKPAMQNLISKVTKDPARHYTMTINPTGGHDMRLRHLGSLMSGNKASAIMPHPDGTFTISQERHGTDPLVSSWHINQKGQATDVSKQHGFKHPAGSVDFTQSFNRSRFGTDSKLLPKPAEQNTNNLKFVTGKTDKKIVKSEGEQNVSNDRRTILSENTRTSLEEIRGNDQGRTSSLDRLHRGNLLKSYVILPLASKAAESLVPPAKSFSGLGSNIRATVLFKNQEKIPAVIIENPSDFTKIIKHAMDHGCEFIVISSNSKNEILYTKGKDSGKMHVGIASVIKKSEPEFGLQLDDYYIEYGSTDGLYLTPSPFTVPKQS